MSVHRLQVTDSSHHHGHHNHHVKKRRKVPLNRNDPELLTRTSYVDASVAQLQIKKVNKTSNFYFSVKFNRLERNENLIVLKYTGPLQ